MNAGDKVIGPSPTYGPLDDLCQQICPDTGGHEPSPEVGPTGDSRHAAADERRCQRAELHDGPEWCIQLVGQLVDLEHEGLLGPPDMAAAHGEHTSPKRKPGCPCRQASSAHRPSAFS